MVKTTFILFSMIFFVSTSFAQQELEQTLNEYNEVIETNDHTYPSYADVDGIAIIPVKWIPYDTDCRQCRSLSKQYNTAMQELFNVRGLVTRWEVLKNFYDKRIADKQTAQKALDAVMELNAALPNVTVGEPEPLTDEQVARDLEAKAFADEIFLNQLPKLREALDQLEVTAQNLRRTLAECEALCTPNEDRKNLVSLPATEIIQDPKLPFDWKGPYYEVCEACRKLTARLNNLYDIGINNANELNSIKARLAYLQANLLVLEASKSEDDRKMKELRKKLRNIRRDIKNAEKEQERILKNQEKIIKNFNETLAKYNECIKKCPPQKNACLFPDELFSSMIIGPNDEVGSSAQAAKELRDKATGAVKGVATKTLGSLLGFGGGSSGGGGPKMDRDRSRGDFTRISSGDTDLDIRASWRNDQLIVSTEIDDSPDNGTFHAQWIEDIDGNTYLPVRYMIFKMYRDWKLTVSWTEDHYVNGEHVFHDEGQEISTGRDLLGTWSIFEGAEGIANSIWGMLGFDTATKGVRHLGAVYDIPAASFPNDCQMQLVTHISEPSKDPVTTLPIVGDLFKHVDESRRKPETIVLIQPHIVKDAE